MGLWDTRDRCGALRGPGPHGLREGFVAEHMGRDEGPVHESFRDDQVGKPQGQGAIRAGLGLHQQVRPLGGLGAAGIHHHEGRPAVQGLVHEAHLVEVGLRGILAPHHDEPGVGDVPGGAVAVVPQGQARGLEARGPAEVAVGGGAAAELAPEGQAAPVQQALGAAGGIVEHAPGTALGLGLAAAAPREGPGRRPRRSARRPTAVRLPHGDGAGAGASRPAPGS